MIADYEQLLSIMKRRKMQRLVYVSQEPWGMLHGMVEGNNGSGRCKLGGEVTSRNGQDGCKQCLRVKNDQEE